MTTARFRRSPKVLFTEQAYSDLFIIARLHDKEIAMFGFASRVDAWTYLVEEVILPRQHVSSVWTQQDPQEMAELMEEILETRPEDINRLRFWAHSHVNMGVGPSGQDKSQIESLADDVTAFGDEHPFYIAARVNHAGQMQVDVATDILTYEDVSFEVGLDNDTRRAYWQVAIDARVKDMPTTSVTTYSKGNWQTHKNPDPIGYKLPLPFGGDDDEGWRRPERVITVPKPSPKVTARSSKKGRRRVTTNPTG